MKVLITGIGGTIGSILASDLERDHEVHGIDLQRLDRPRTHTADLTDGEALPSLFEGMDAVIHLAAERRHGPEIGWDILMPRNMVATANVFDAAHRAGVRRVVFASSMHVMGGYELDEPWASVAGGRYEGLDSDSLPLVGAGLSPRPDGRYAVSKEFGEMLGKYWSEADGMEVVSVRLGTVSANDRPNSSDPRSFVSWFSHRDLAGFFRAAIERSGLNHEILYGASANTWKIYDTPSTWSRLGFTPSDDAESFRPAQ